MDKPLCITAIILAIIEVAKKKRYYSMYYLCCAPLAFSHRLVVSTRIITRIQDFFTGGARDQAAHALSYIHIARQPVSTHTAY